MWPAIVIVGLIVLASGYKSGWKPWDPTAKKK